MARPPNVKRVPMAPNPNWRAHAERQVEAMRKEKAAAVAEAETWMAGVRKRKPSEKGPEDEA